MFEGFHFIWLFWNWFYTWKWNLRFSSFHEIAIFIFDGTILTRKRRFVLWEFLFLGWISWFIMWTYVVLLVSRQLNFIIILNFEQTNLLNLRWIRLSSLFYFIASHSWANFIFGAGLLNRRKHGFNFNNLLIVIQILVL